jgi:hypothetical protein
VLTAAAVAVLVWAFGSPAGAQTAPDAGTGISSFQGLYLLRFNRWGDLTNPTERDLAIAQLRANRQVERIVIISYGWANDAEASYAMYRSLLADIAGAAEPFDWPAHTAVIAVGWDSSQRGFRKLFNDLLPLPFVADTLAYVPDKLLFPLSFWSKAAMADRIGLGGLRIALNRIFSEAYPDAESHPDVLLIGHSFGTRIVSGLLQDRMGLLPVRREAFKAAPHVVGAILTQPAAVLWNLHERADYPILVTQSRHDHANGLLFPLANVVINAYSFTTFEGLLEYRVFEYVEDTVQRTAEGVGGIVTAPLPGIEFPRRQPELEEEREEQRRLSRMRYLARRSLAELVAIPAAVGFTLLATPLAYAYTQIHGLVTHPVDHFMDTLAQLPVVEVPVYALDRALDREILWGSRAKGFFNLGSLHESIGRTVTPRIYPRNLPRVYTPAELEQIATREGPCPLPTCQGVFAVDASTLIRLGTFRENLERPWVDFTIGWFDPIGAHIDYRNRDVVRLMGLLIRRSTRP